MGAVCLVAHLYLPAAPPDNVWVEALRVLGLIALGAGVYFGGARVLRR